MTKRKVAELPLDAGVARLDALDARIDDIERRLLRLGYAVAMGMGPAFVGPVRAELISFRAAIDARTGKVST